MGLLKWLVKTLGLSRDINNSNRSDTSASPGEAWVGNRKNAESIELIVLSKFLKPSGADVIPENWISVIGVPSTVFVERLIKSGKLIKSPLVATIVHCNSAPTLKEWCKERRLKVTGKKLDLAQRLIDADYAKMERLHKGRELLECAPESRARAESYIAEKEAERSAVAREGCFLFGQEKFNEMIELVENYEARQVRMPGLSLIMGFDGTTSVRDTEYRPRNRSDDLKTIRGIAVAAPKILASMTADDLDALRAYCAMRYLMRDSMPLSDLPSSFRGIERLGIAGTWRMMHFHLKHLHDIERMKSIDVKKVEVMTSGVSAGTCAACIKISKVYGIGSVPELPFQGCTCDAGCRCWYRAIIKGFE